MGEVKPRMRIQSKQSILLAAALMLATSFACWGQEATSATLSPKILPSIVTLNIRRLDGMIATATAFAGVKEGALVTALHIIKDASKVTATFPNGEEFDCAGIIDKDERRNLALIRIKAFGRPMLKINPAEPAVGDKLFVPVVKEGAFGVVETSVTEVLIKGGIKFYQLAGAFPGGNSGSPIIDARGDVVGVHVTIVQDDKNVEMALPGAYILGLEPSLPVQPWGQPPQTAQGGSQQTPASAAAAGPSASLDNGLASALIKVHDTWTSYTTFSANIYRITRYSNLGHLDLYRVQSDLDNMIAQMGWLKTDDPLRQRLVQATGQLLAKERQALEFDINCANLNKNTPPGKAVPQAEEFGQRASALFNSIPGHVAMLKSDFRQLAQNSPEFLKALPIEMRYFLGVTDRKSKLTLGLFVPANNPFQIQGFVITKGSLETGFHGGDTIVSAGGRTWKAEDDIEDFKLMIEENSGKVLEVVVRRGDKMKALSLKIPPDVFQRNALNPQATFWP